MKNKKYRIGEVAKICNISKRTLRYYDEIGLLLPSETLTLNQYRTYTEEDLHKIPIIKYYKESGFKLEDIKQMMNKYDLKAINVEQKFDDKIQELENLEEDLKNKRKAVEEWLFLIKEAEIILEEDTRSVNIKKFKKTEMVFLEQGFNFDYRESIVNIKFNNHIEKIGNLISGPVIIEFLSLENRCLEKCTTVKIMQKYLKKGVVENLVEFGGIAVASYYCVGSHKNLKNGYKKLKKWLEDSGLEYEDKCYERYVLDYWTSNDENKFVTEIIVPLKNYKL